MVSRAKANAFRQKPPEFQLELPPEAVCSTSDKQGNKLSTLPSDFGSFWQTEVAILPCIGPVVRQAFDA